MVWHVSPVKKSAFLSRHTSRKSRSSACVKSCTSSTKTSSMRGPPKPPSSAIAAWMWWHASITSYSANATFHASYLR